MVWSVVSRSEANKASRGEGRVPQALSLARWPAPGNRLVGVGVPRVQNPVDPTARLLTLCVQDEHPQGGADRRQGAEG